MHLDYVKYNYCMECLGKGKPIEQCRFPKTQFRCSNTVGHGTGCRRLRANPHNNSKSHVRKSQLKDAHGELLYQE